VVRAVRIRLKRTPSAEDFAEFDVSTLRAGEVVDLSVRLATLLIISGDADPVVGPWDRAEADDAPARPPTRKPEIS
jgi:hypothetical protein